MERVSKIYQYPGHADRLVTRIVEKHIAQGQTLIKVDKGYFLGSGVSMKMDFEERPDSGKYKMLHFYGFQRPDTDEAFNGWEIFTILPMCWCWMTIGYFYVLRREREETQQM